MPNFEDLIVKKDVDSQTIVIKNFANDEDRAAFEEIVDSVLSQVKNLYEEARPSKLIVTEKDDEYHVEFQHCRLAMSYLINYGSNDNLIISFLVNNNPEMQPAWYSKTGKKSQTKTRVPVDYHMGKRMRKDPTTSSSEEMVVHPMTYHEARSTIRRFMADAHSAINQVLRHLSQDDDAANSIS